jgi:hypothetical protein
VYAVTRDLTARAPREVPRPVVLAAAATAAAVVLAIAAFAGSQFLASPGGASPSAIAAPSTQPVVIGPLPIGTYISREFQPPVTFKIDDQGWTANRDQAEVLGLIRDAAPRGSVYFLRVDKVLENPCVEGGEGAQTGPGAADLITKLEALDHLALANQQPAQVGGFAGQQVDVTVSDGVFAACGGVAGGEAAILGAGEEVWSASPGERFRLISVGVGDQAVTLLLSTDWTQTPSVQELENLLERGQRVIDSVRF